MQVLEYIVDVGGWCLFAEGDDRFFIVDLLARNFFIGFEAVLVCVTVILISLEENEIIVSEEQVGNHGTPPHDFDPLQ